MENQNRLVQSQPASGKVSIIARLIPVCGYLVPAAGAALGALLFMSVIRAMRNAETAGLAAVAGGLAGANIPTLGALYVSIVIGLVAILIVLARDESASATASGWFYLIAGMLGLGPVLLYWQAESLLIGVLVNREVGIVSVAARISQYLVLTPVMAFVAALILLVASFVPLPAFRAKRKAGPVIVLVLFEIALIVLAVAFQLRTSWLNQVRLTERL